MDDLGFKKIDLSDENSESSKKTPVKSEKSTMVKSRSIKFIFLNKFVLIPVVLLVILVLVGTFVGTKSLIIIKDVKKVQSQAKIAADAAKKQNIVLAKTELVKTQAQLTALKKDLSSLTFLSFIPYIKDAQKLSDAGIHGVKAAIITADSVIPYADVLGLKGEKSFVMGSAEDRIRLAVKTMGKVVPKIDDIEKELVLAKTDIDSINVSRYPNFLFFKKIKDQITQVKNLVDGSVLAVDEGKPLIKVLPALLGEKESKKYMVLFQNDNELRPTGGFLTFYTLFRVEEGVIKIDRASDIYKLDESISSHPPAPEIITKYLPKVYSFNIRDSNLSPDFALSMKAFNDLYKKSSDKQNIDGIIALDTKFLVRIIDILGEVQADGQTFTAKTDPACNCPQVVYQLELNTTKPVGFIRQNRKAIVGDLLLAIMQKSLKSSPKLYWGKLFQEALTGSAEKHVLFYMFSDDAQKGVESLNWGGRIKNFEGDYLHINDANFAGAKSNMYIKTAVKVEYDVSGTGEVTKTLTIDYKNPQKHSDCNLESGGLCLNATLRTFQRVYVPEGSVLSSSRGSEVKVETKKDLGKTYFESFFTVKPLGKSQVTYKYTLPFKVKSGSPLPVLIQKQPGTTGIMYEIWVNGKKVDSFDLATDKELSLKVF